MHIYKTIEEQKGNIVNKDLYEDYCVVFNSRFEVTRKTEDLQVNNKVQAYKSQAENLINACLSSISLSKT